MSDLEVKDAAACHASSSALARGRGRTVHRFGRRRQLARRGWSSGAEVGWSAISARRSTALSRRAAASLAIAGSVTAPVRGALRSRAAINSRRRATSPSVVTMRRLRAGSPVVRLESDRLRRLTDPPRMCFCEGWAGTGRRAQESARDSIIRLAPGRLRERVGLGRMRRPPLVIECTTSDFPTRSAVCKLRAHSGPVLLISCVASSRIRPKHSCFGRRAGAISATRVSLTRQRCWETAFGHSRMFHVFEARPQPRSLRLSGAAGL
jgi:hypothetical protein